MYPTTFYTYVCLILLRVISALFGTGYIHPDEYFQNGELTAGDLFNLHTLRTWEWSPVFPCRSVIPPFLTTGIPFATAKYLSSGERPLDLFHLERSSFLSLSFLLDFAVSRLVSNPQSRIYALLLISSSHVVNAFQVRPLSNSIESVLLALSLVAFKSILEKKPVVKLSVEWSNPFSLHILALLFVLGTFTRITFLAFGLPIALQTIIWTFQVISDRPGSSLGGWLRLVFPPLCTACVTGLGFILSDTLYFNGRLTSLTFTPFNFLSYNLSSRVASEHGLHPRWLHVAVNLPMMVGPGLMIHAFLAAIKQWTISRPGKGDSSKENVTAIMNRTMICIILVSLITLSIPRHQEPRFLMPLLVPFIVLVANSGEILRTGKIFWTTWIVMNVVLSILFGFLHQAGVVPTLSYLRGEVQSVISNSSRINIIYWKTYMPPRHLMGIRNQNADSGQVVVTDLAGAAADVLLQTLENIIPTVADDYILCPQTYLVAPLYATEIVDFRSHNLSLQKRVFPHLDMDHIGESLEIGLRDGFTLGVYSVDAECNQVPRE